MIRKFIKRSAIPSNRLYLYREAKKNIGRSSHSCERNGDLSKPKEYNPYMTLIKAK